MPEPTPPRRPLATFLRRTDAAQDTPPAPDAQDAVPDDDALLPASAAVRADEAPAEATAETIAGEELTVTATPPRAHEPGFLRGPSARLRTPRWQWGMVAGLSLLLAVQIAVADRERLAADATTRPWVAALCGALRCSLPTWREPTAFTMTSRDVRPVAGQAGALQVQASVRNDARWAQDWPTLRLSLSDADGRVIGVGVFTASDYLDADAATASPLEPGQSARIAFQVREPAASTLAFNFEFL